jgi:HEAT repeat protein
MECIGDRYSMVDSDITIRIEECIKDLNPKHCSRRQVEVLWELEDIAETANKSQISQIIEALIKAFSEMWVGEGAAKALGNIGDKQAVKPLIKALSDEGDMVCAYAALALGMIGDEIAVDPLIKALKEECLRLDKLDQTAEMIIEALAEIGGKRAAEPLIEALKGKLKLKNTTTDNKYWYGNLRLSNERILSALRKISNDSTIVLLIELLDGDWRQQRFAIKEIKDIPDDRAIIPIIELLDNDRWEIRRHAVIALRNNDAKQAIGRLVESLNDDDDTVRKLVISTLVKFGKKSVERLKKVLKDDSSIVRTGAARALGEIGDQGAIEDLKEVLSNEEDVETLREIKVALLKLKKRNNSSSE